MSNSFVYRRCEDHLSQGDIFSIPFVAPYADNEIRIFRERNGLHGLKVFEDASYSGKVFDFEDLRRTLENLPPDLQEPPFSQNEMVVVFAELLTFFVVASQTCDISGKDGTPKHFAAVLPVVTLSQYLSTQKLPIESSVDDPENWITIVDYLEEKTEASFLEFKHDPFSLSEKVREFIVNWDPPKKGEQKQREIRNRIRRVITDLLNNKKLYIYYIPSKKELSVPEGYIDFCKIFTIPTSVLQNIRGYRVAKLSTPYCEEFAQKLGNYLGRIATPQQLLPPEI